MATALDNTDMPWSCVSPPEHGAKVSSLGAIRILAKLREFHQSLCLHPTKNLGVVWASTCLDEPCEQGSNVVLEATVLCRGRPKAMLGAAMP
jgi:hypothetical protein